MEKTIAKKSFMSLVVAFLMLLSIVAFNFDNAFDAKAAGNGFHVSGTKILDGNNQEFIMRGVNIPYVWYPYETQTSLKGVASRGANTVRIVCSDGDAGYYEGKTTASKLSGIISMCKSNKLVCVLEVHDTTGKNDVTSLNNAVNYWIEMKSVLQGNEDYVILNIANEWYGSWNNAYAWAEGYKTAIKNLRNAGIKNMLMVDAEGYGQWPSSIFQKGTEVFNADSLKNTVFSIHMYDTAGKNEYTVVNNIDNALALNIPLVIGEFGADHAGSDVDEATIMSYCTQKNVGYLGWSWKGNSSDLASLDIANDWSGSSLTSWGNTLFNSTYGIKNTSKICSIYTGIIDSSSNSSTVDDSSLPPVEGTPEYVSTNLTLTGIIGANAYYTVPDGYINSNYKVEAVFKASGVAETRVALNTGNTKTINGKKTYIFTLPVKSCDMAKRFSVKLVISTAASGKQVASTTTTAITLNNYIASLANTGSTNEKTFAKAMQTYGYYSQKMFNPSSTLPSITPIDLSDVTYRTVRSYSASTQAFSGTKKGTISGTSLYLDAGTGIRSYVKDLSGVNTNNLYMQYTANGVTKRVKAQYSSEQNAYFGEISDISADKLSTMYDIYFCEGTTQITDTSKYGAYSYIYSTLRTASSTDAQNLAKALYKYSVAAEQLVG